jgi:hypothetical protein
MGKPLNKMTDAELSTGMNACQVEIIKLQELQAALAKERRRRVHSVMLEAKRVELEALEKSLV